MSKKWIFIIAAIAIIATAGFIGFGIYHSVSTEDTFESDGYILREDGEEVKTANFASGDVIKNTFDGNVSFTDAQGQKQTVSKESFVHFNNSGVTALSNGTLLDFDDLSENFINNYYVSEGIVITPSNGTYTADTTAGTLQFGENLWKLSDNSYMIQSPSLKIHISDSDVRDVTDYVQVIIGEDGIVRILTQDDLWMTLSDECYIETAGGVKVNPVTQIIDNGEFKMSLAKLTVTPDDAIVLTSDETRTQIVPEINITAIDGTDGEDGTEGEAGQGGGTGSNGTNGGLGGTGSDGSTGGDGGTGSGGTGGNTGKSGGDGSVGSTGKSGSTGSTGATGAAAVVESSINSALPTMAITDWQISPTGLKGEITVTDTAEYLSKNAPLLKASYPGRVTITEVDTGTVVTCYQLTSLNQADAAQESAKDFTDCYGASKFYFCSSANAQNPSGLKPDTKYKLSVVCYYNATMDETSADAKTIYSREFISRTFYTDSAGVTLSYKNASTNSVTIDANVSSLYLTEGTTIQNMEVYLLTPEQNETFGVGSRASSANYVQVKQLTANIETSNTLTFTSGTGTEVITPDTNYVARVYVELSSGLTTLTTQELEVKTLKRVPTSDSAEIPTASYNRAANAIEVYRPTVTDVDSAVVSYTYKVYKDGVLDSTMTRTVTPSQGEPVQFQGVTPGTNYTFEVLMEYNDNEKSVVKSLGTSEVCSFSGTSMPKLTLTIDSQGQDYDLLKGFITVTMSGISKAKITPSTPLQLELYSDEISGSHLVELTAANTPVNVLGSDNSDMGKMTLDETAGSTEFTTFKVALDLQKLRKNTEYRIEVWAYVDLGDGNEFKKLSLGSVNFETFKPVTLTANWSTPSTYSTKFARTFSLTPETMTGEYAYRTTNALNNLESGQVTLTLYSGIGASRIRIAQKIYTDSTDLKKIYSSEGIELNENVFGVSNITQATGYTIVVSDVADESVNYETELGYVNTFDDVVNASTTVTAVPTPPDLLTDPTKGVTATAITNINASNYGGSYNKTLPDDAIVGYTLASTYLNDQRLATNITYYAYEFNTFYNEVNGNYDPVYESLKGTSYDEALVKVTLPVASTSDSVPKVALFFGADPGNGTDGTYNNGYYVTYAGAANKTENQLKSGMDRGYYYIFAYTVEYSTGEEGSGVKYYPYSMGTYDNFKKNYGIMKLATGNWFGNSLAYDLNSGICAAPVVMPNFHAYLYKCDLSLPTVSQTLANVEIHYSWRDVEASYDGNNPVITDSTQISYTRNGTPVTQNLIDSSHVVDTGWYKFEVDSIPVGNGATVTFNPSVSISEYRLDYTNSVGNFMSVSSSASYPICEIPLDFDFKDLFNSSQTQYSNMKLQMTVYKDLNKIEFVFVAPSTLSAIDLTKRASHLALTFSVTDSNNKTTTKTLLTRLVSEGADTVIKASVATGDLGDAFVGKTFTVTRAALYYDTGEMGWEYAQTAAADTSKQTLIMYQNIDAATEDEPATLGSYYSASKSNGLVANGAALTPNYSSKVVSDTVMASIRSTVGATSDADSKLLLSTTKALGSSSFSMYTYAGRWGTIWSSSSLIDDVSRLEQNVFIPKEVGIFTLGFVNNQNTGVIETIVPTMTKESLPVSSTSVGVYKMEVNGFGTTGGTVYMQAYRNKQDAADFANPVGNPTEITIGSDGKPTASDYPKINNLPAGTEGQANVYYVSFYYLDNGTKTHILDTDTADSAIYEVTLSDQVVFTLNKSEYVNKSYFDKYFKINYQTNRYFNLTFSYDLFLTEAEAAKADGTPYKTQAELQKDDMMTLTGGGYGETEVMFHLNPAQRRSMLEPGKTYYLRIQAKGSAEPHDVEGQVVYPIEITALGNKGALVYVTSATKDTINWTVTLNDTQHSIMGVEGQSGDTTFGRSGVYAVRFTDGENNLIKTKYDDQTFDVGTLRQTFILNDANITKDNIGEKLQQMYPESEYKMYIFAAYDEKHVGSVKQGSETKTYTDYFSSSATSVATCGTAFNELVNSFWNSDKSMDTTKADLRNSFLIYTKSAHTTTESGYYLNTDKIYADRVNETTIRVVFMESSGLVDSKGDSIFRYIAWSVDGFTSGEGDIVNVDGVDTGVKTIQTGTYAGYDVYSFTLSPNLPKGTYTIILDMKTSADSQAEPIRITVPSAV